MGRHPRRPVPYATNNMKYFVGAAFPTYIIFDLYVLLYHKYIPNARQLYIFVVGISKNLLEKIVFFIVFAIKSDIMFIEGRNCTVLTFRSLRRSAVPFRGGHILCEQQVLSQDIPLFSVR